MINSEEKCVYFCSVNWIYFWEIPTVNDLFFKQTFLPKNFKNSKKYCNKNLCKYCNQYESIILTRVLCLLLEYLSKFKEFVEFRNSKYIFHVVTIITYRAYVFDIRRLQSTLNTAVICYRFLKKPNTDILSELKF